MAAKRSESALVVTSRYFGVVSAALGFAVLLGWAFDVTALKSIIPGAVTMKANTALCALFMGTSLCLQRPVGRFSARGFSDLLALLSLLLVSATIAETAVGVDIGLDGLLFAEAPGAVLTIHPGKMSNLAMAAIAGTSLALLAAGRRTHRLAEAGALVGFISGFTSLSGYLFSLKGVVAPLAWTPMALPASMAFTVLPVGIILAWPDRGMISILLGEGEQLKTARRILLATPATLLVATWLRIRGAHMGLFNDDFGAVLMMTLSIAVLTVVVAFSTSAANRTEKMRKAAEDLAAETAGRLRQILDVLPAGVSIYAPDGTLVESNPAAVRIAEGIAALNPRGMAGTESSRELPAIFERALTGEAVVTDVEVRHERQGKGAKILNWSLSPLKTRDGSPSGAVAAFFDVTARKAAEEKLRKANRFNEALNDVLALFNRAATRSEVFEGILSLLARDPHLPVFALYALDKWGTQLERQAAWGLAPGAPGRFGRGEGLVGQAAEAKIPVILAFPKGETGFGIETGLGTVAPVALGAFPVVFKESAVAVLVVASTSELKEEDCSFFERLCAQLGIVMNTLRQVEDMRLLVEELGNRSEEVNRQNEELARASKMKSEFLANMSHELRTPLNSIIGFSETLRDGLAGEVSETQADYLQEIFQSGQHLLSLINDILDLSKVEAGEMVLEAEPTPVEELLRSCLLAVREKAANHSIRLNFEPSPDLGIALLDTRRVKQIVYNLLSNAVKFTGDGGVVTLEAGLSPRDGLEGIEISVSDTGIGIPADQLGKLFRPFVQVDSSLARRFEGTGLGLAMVKRLAELHGGGVNVKSEAGVGSRFAVWLPLCRRESETAETATAKSVVVETVAAEAASRRRRPEAPKVLVIEDDPGAANLIKLALEEEGIEVEAVADAESALLSLEAHQPDLIVLDLILPKMDGLSFFRLVREKTTLSRIPIVIVSIIAEEKKGLTLGAAAVLQKPVERAALLEVLGRLGFIDRTPDKPKVLVVDDDPKTVKLLGDMLKRENFEVLTSYGGREGLAVARARKPDLLVLDLLMPDMDGFAVVDAIRKEKSLDFMPILVVTAKDLSDRDFEVLKGNISVLIEKSKLDAIDFITEVRRALYRRPDAYGSRNAEGEVIQ